MVVDFGNGITASTLDATEAPFGIVDHDGLVFPDLDVAVTENGILDGGVIGSTRAKMRHMRVDLIHEAALTRAQVSSAFSPGITRTLTAVLTLGGVSMTVSMPYVVESVTFPANLLRARRQFSVAFVSSLAYPEARRVVAETAAIGSTGGLAYDYGYPVSYDTLTAVTSIGFENDGQIPSAAVVTVTLQDASTDLQVVTAAGTSTVTGALVAGDIVVIDAEKFTVTVNGVNRLSWWSRTGVWPRVDAGYNAVSTNRLGQIAVTWKPRVFGVLVGD